MADDGGLLRCGYRDPRDRGRAAKVVGTGEASQRIGWLTAMVGIGFIVAGAFTTDPTGVTDLTAEGAIHVVGSLLVFPFIVIGAFLLRGVFSRDEGWKDFAAKTRWFAYALLAGLVVSFATPDGGAVGLTQRIFAGIIMAWLATLAWQLRTAE